MLKPVIIVLEGLDFAGKSTQSQMLVDGLRATGRTVARLADPGGTRFGEIIRSIVKDGEFKLSGHAQFFAFLAARAELAARINELHSEGTDVVLDRWWPSTFAYQGAQGIDGHDIIHLSKTYCSIPERTLMLYMDVSTACAHERKVARQEPRDPGLTVDRFESKDDDFRATLRARYNLLVADGYMTRIDADPEPELIRIAIASAIAAHFTE